MRSSALLALSLALLTSACGDPPPGRIRGDAFVVDEAGREVNLARAPVRLVEDARDGAVLDSALARACPTRHGVTAGSATPAAQERAWRERARILQERTRRTVRTDARARFAIDSVPPGWYRLWADTTLPSGRWTWLEPVRVRAGDSVRVELSNANPDENPFRCRTHGTAAAPDTSGGATP